MRKQQMHEIQVKIEPALLNEESAAEYLSLSRRGLRYLVSRGDIRQVRIAGMRRVAYSVEELRALADRWKSA